VAIRFGVAGIGWWASDVHIPNVNLAGNATVAAICSRSEENRRNGRDLCEGEVHLFADYAEMIESDVIDAVIVCTPNPAHADYTVAALRAGKHVLCEKPLAVTREDARRVAEAAREADRVLGVGFELRSADVTLAVRRAVEAGRIGRPVMATGRSWRGGRSMGTTWRSDKERSGGVLAELFCHAADLQAALLDEFPGAAWARAGRLQDAPDWDRATVVFDYPSGAFGVVNFTLLAPGMDNEYPFEIVGEEGRLVGEVLSGMLTLWPAESKEPEDLSAARPDGTIYGFPGSLDMIEDFADCVEGRKPGPRAGLEAGLAAVESCVAIEESIATGRRVTLEVRR